MTPMLWVGRRTLDLSFGSLSPACPAPISICLKLSFLFSPFQPFSITTHWHGACASLSLSLCMSLSHWPSLSSHASSLKVPMSTSFLPHAHRSPSTPGTPELSPSSFSLLPLSDPQSHLDPTSSVKLSLVPATVHSPPSHQPLSISSALTGCPMTSLGQRGRFRDESTGIRRLLVTAG